MSKDTRITIGLALLYFLNGFMNVFGPSKAFLPLVFLDSFLLAGLSIVFVFLPKFSKTDLLFLMLGIYFTVQGLFIVGYFMPNTIEIILNISFLVFCAGLYFFQLLQFKKIDIVTTIPFVMFLFSILFGYISVSAIWIIICSGIGALMQIYTLARPDLLDQFSTTTKRFYLLMTIQVFFDTVSYIFFKINASGVNFQQ
jgi:hypothetical protein